MIHCEPMTQLQLQLVRATVLGAIGKIFTSTKTWTMLIGAAATAGASALAKYGLELSDDTITQIAITAAGLVGILLHAQGQADQGKERAKIDAAVAAEPSDMTRALNDPKIQAFLAHFLAASGKAPPAPAQPTESGVIS